MRDLGWWGEERWVAGVRVRRGGELCESKKLHYHVKGTNQGDISGLGECRVCRLLYDPSLLVRIEELYVV